MAQNTALQIPAPNPAARAFCEPICDRRNPKSLVNLLPEPQAKALEAIPIDLFAMSEQTYWEKYQPEPILTRLKLQLYVAWQEAVATDEKIPLARIYHGICTREFLIRLFDKHPELVVWVVTPPATNQFQMEELFFSGLRRVQEVLQMPLWEDAKPRSPSRRGPKPGKVPKRPNVPMIKVMLDTMKFLCDRVQGSVVQRQSLDARLLALTMSQQSPGTVIPPSLPGQSGMTPSQILAQLEQATAEVAPELKFAANVVDAEASDDE